jgi:hypothetical protein
MNNTGERYRRQPTADEVQEKITEWLGRPPNAIELDEAYLFLSGGTELVEKVREYARKAADHKRKYPDSPPLYEIYESQQ